MSFQSRRGDDKNATWFIRVTAPGGEAYHIKGGYTVPVIGLAICIWLASHASARDWKTIGALLFVGFALYALERRFVNR